MGSRPSAATVELLSKALNRLCSRDTVAVQTLCSDVNICEKFHCDVYMTIIIFKKSYLITHYSLTE